MLPLYQGIYNYFTANSGDNFYTSIGGRLYFESAKSNAIKPYAVWHPVGGEPVDRWFTHVFESPRLQISLWDDGLTGTKPRSSTRILQIAEYCKDFYDLAQDNGLTVSGWSVINFDRDSVQPPILYDEKRNEWLQPLIYEVRLQKAR